MTADGLHAVIYSETACAAWLCLFDKAGREAARLPMARTETGFECHAPGVTAGQRYGFRTDGDWNPDQGLFHDPAKLLADPYATRFDRPWIFDARLSAARNELIDTAPLVPKAIIEKPAYRDMKPAVFKRGGLIYEVNVRAFTMLHPDVPEADRGTVKALAHPCVIAHLQRIGVSAVELMPVTAWIDERHLPPLGLSNAWGYNPVTFMAVDPRLCPSGIADLRKATDALHKAGIGMILDLVFNHSGESDRFGPVISLRGLCGRSPYRMHDGQPGHLVNDTGCGNTVQCDHPAMRRLILASLRHFVLAAGVDGFRFDLAPIMGRDAHGFRRDAVLLSEIGEDPVLKDRVLVAEPWDIGPGGYQLGNFPHDFLEWNDRARDDIRRFWRGDDWTLGALATRLAGSADIFNHNHAPATRTVNFIAAHDGFTLADLVAYSAKHNAANGEDNRDGHNENHSWNNGIEGETEDAATRAARRADVKALLSTLFAMRGAIMLTAGDEFARTQHGNNNAYCQDNAAFWVDWAARDIEIERHTASLASLRARHAALRDDRFLTGEKHIGGYPDVDWQRLDGAPMQAPDWDDASASSLMMVLADMDDAGAARLAVVFNRSREAPALWPPARRGWRWRDGLTGTPFRRGATMPPRSVLFLEEFQPG
ncbi:MAG: glycogen debranching protein GlgX [Rhizobiaceae bacterium]|nr:glycogen debranching protein GlgX [Rhizobiaceae bacterium]